MNDLTPRQIVAALDRYIIGQVAAKRAIAVAIRNRWRRLQLPAGLREEVGPKNILMMGPTGVGKTEIARRMAALVNAPFLKVEATKFTEVGYVGRDVDSIIRDLVELAVAMVQKEQTEVVREKAEMQVEERLLDELLPDRADAPPSDDAAAEDAETRRQRTREKLRRQLRSGELDDHEIELRVEQKVAPMGMFATTVGPDQIGPEIQDLMERLMPGQARARRVSIREARHVIFAMESEKLIDRDKVHEMAIERTQSGGIVFIDEMDKLCGGRHDGPDVSRQGVQRDLLPIIEGSTVNTRYGVVKTDHILFVAAGAFHSAKPSDLMPELQGRLPIRVELEDLTQADFVRILTEPENALTKQQVALLATEGVTVKFTPDAIEAAAQIAAHVNQRTENIGARRLHTVMERLMEDLSFEAPEKKGARVTIDAAYVQQRLAEIVKDEDLSKFIL